VVNSPQEVIMMQAQELLDVRKARGFEIAQAGQIKKNGNGWLLLSQTALHTM